MLKFNYKSLRVLPKFFQYRNEIDIYTEDELKDKEFYKTLLNRLVKEPTKIRDITPLGSKNNVLEEHRKLSVNKSRKRLFIVDGDLDLINGVIETGKDLFVLDSYCIENYLIDEKAAVELAYYNVGVKSRSEIISQMKFDEWLATFQNPFRRLFILMAIARFFKADYQLKSCHHSLKKRKKSLPTLDLTKVEKHGEDIIKSIEDKLIEIGDPNPSETINSEILRLEAKWPNNKKTLLKIVSGKNYLLPLLNLRISEEFRTGNSLFPTKSFKIFLAQHVDLRRLNELSNAINK